MSIICNCFVSIGFEYYYNPFGATMQPQERANGGNQSPSTVQGASAAAAATAVPTIDDQDDIDAVKQFVTYYYDFLSSSTISSSSSNKGSSGGGQSSTANRQLIVDSFYVANRTRLLLNGHCFTTPDDCKHALMHFLPPTHHSITIETLDFQKLREADNTFLITTGGAFNVLNEDSIASNTNSGDNQAFTKRKVFFQTFMLTSINNAWKLLSDSLNILDE